jgi:murein DD-endopeptidase MepM/ murein hydrolase activator NlpD
MFRSRPALAFGAALVLVTAAAAQTTYVVQPGDTLTGLARTHNTTVEAIVAANGLSSTDLRAGATLVIPDPARYTVRSGDTLSGIAQAVGMPVEELMALNNLTDTRITIGQTLVVQRPPATGAATTPPPLTVEVARGESLWVIANRHGVSVEALARANGLSPDARLRVGDRLTVPGAHAGNAATADKGGGAEPRVTVAAGESLSEIAARHNTTVDALMSANGLTSDLLNPGETLLIPPASPNLDAGAPGIIWPLRGVITSYYGPRNLLGMTYHYGIDIDGDVGDPIVAAMSGTVTYSGWLGGYGYLVIIQDGDIEYYYAHASELLVSVGQWVEAGQMIARVGATGRVTGPHLHFEIRIGGQPVDPLPYLERTAQLP